MCEGNKVRNTKYCKNSINNHWPAALQTDNSEIVAISSRNLKTAEKFASKLGIKKAYGSYDELLNNPDIDAIINPLPISMHHEWTIKAAEAGKHIKEKVIYDKQT